MHRFASRTLLIVFLLLPFQGVFAKAPHSTKPLIGILLNDGGEGGYSIYPWYAMRKNYSDIIAKQGGVPVFIGHDVSVVEDYLDKLDGIVLTGGDLKSPPQGYEKGEHKRVEPKYYSRHSIEFVIVQGAYKRNIPLLGICAGMQNMNVALGGTLQNLKEAGKTSIEHRVDNREQIQHQVIVVPNSLLYRIMKKKQFGVNSNHREGILRLSDKYVVTARAPDNVIEAFEAPNKTFFVGVIWHPEFVLSDQDKALWHAFVQASAGYAAKKKHAKINFSLK